MILSKNKKGFTLIEVVFVLVLVGGVFLALYGIFGKIIINDNESANEIIASNLVQEGIEIVRNVRDENALNPAAYINEGLAAGECFPFLDSATVPSCEGSTVRSSSIEKLTDNTYQNCASGGCTNDETIFKRTCYIDSGPVGGVPTGAFAVSCVVEWTGLSGIPRKARAMSILTDWLND